MAWMGRFREFGCSGVISSRKFSIVPLPLSFEQLVVLVHCIGVALFFLCLLGFLSRLEVRSATVNFSPFVRISTVFVRESSPPIGALAWVEERFKQVRPLSDAD